MRGIGLFVVAIVGVLLLALYTMTFSVHQTELALLKQFGQPLNVVDQPGLHFKLPWQEVVAYPKLLLDFEPRSEEVIAADQKRLVVDAYARYRITDPLKFYQTVGTEDVVRARLGSIMTGSLRRVIGNVELQAVVSNKRAEIMRTIRDEVNAQARDFGIDVVDVRIRRADLPEGNSQAIYDRMKSERQREATLFRAEGQRRADQIRAEADRTKTEILADANRQAQIARGEGDAVAIATYAGAYEKDPHFYAFYRSLEAYRNSLSGDGTTLVLSPDSEFFRFLENGPTGAPPSGEAARKMP